QLGQCSTSTSKTRLSSRAQLMRAGAGGAGAGTLLLRNFALGASTSWKRIRWRRGRGTGGARRPMNSSGSMTIWVVASLYGLLSCSTTWPARLRLSRLLAMAGPVMSAELLEFFTLIGAPPHRRVQAKAVRVDMQLRGGRALTALGRLC